MADSSSASDLLVLPKGGGALSGIGEKFAPDLHTGTGNLTIPLPLPQGRNGFQPDLSLGFSSGSGNGPFGLGWSLSLPAIMRKTSAGLPSYDDAKDTFILAGEDDLVAVPGGPAGAQQYRPRTEGAFSQILHFPAGDRWDVTAKNGQTMVFGGQFAPGGGGGPDSAVVADPSRRDHIFCWKPSSATDPFGNRIEYEYERDLQTGNRAWDQLYLKRIRYADYDSGAATTFLLVVEFEYENRTDWFSDRRPGFEIRTAKRCSAIKLLTRDGAELARTYELDYLDGGTGPQALRPANAVSLLRSLTVTGHDGTQTESLPPTSFAYSRFDPEKRDFRPLGGEELPSTSLSDPNLQLADLAGKALPDIVEVNGLVRVWRNLGDGLFEAPREMVEAPAGIALSASGVQLLDADGDGRLDLLAASDGRSGYYPVDRQGGWDRRSFVPYAAAPSFDLQDPEVRLVDMDGDGMTDAVRSGARLEIFFSDRRRGWDRTTRVERHRLDVFPDVDFADPRVRLTDMTGDGLQDVVLVYDGQIEYWPSLGSGRYGRRITMTGSPAFPYDYDPAHVLLGDVDGDGLADLVLVGDRSVSLWVNQAGAGFGQRVDIQGTPSFGDFDDVRLADPFGTGVEGLLWSSEAGGDARDRMLFLDFTGGAKPYLLDEIANHMGAITRIEYASSTRFYVDDARHRRRWVTPLPFPVHVVARTEQVDMFSRTKVVSEYRYHHGCWDGAEREFRGFGMVEQLDTVTRTDYHSAGLGGDADAFEPLPGDSFSPPVLTKTWFHQGPVGDEFGEWYVPEMDVEFWRDDRQLLDQPAAMKAFLDGLPRRARRDALRTLRGRVMRTELYALDGTVGAAKPYTVSEQLHAVASLPVAAAWPAHPAPWQLEVFFPHLLGERTTQWERGEDPLTRFTLTTGYDAHGQPAHETDVALPRRSRKRAKVNAAVIGASAVDERSILARHSFTQYAQPDGGALMYDRVAHVRGFELDSPPLPTEAFPDDLGAIAGEQAVNALSVQATFVQLLDAWTPGDPVPGQLNLVQHTINHYDGAAFAGRAAGKVGPYGALSRTESLAFTEHDLIAAYGSRRPSYLGGTSAPPAGAPAGFGAALGYRLETASPGGYHDGWYVDTSSRRFDFQETPLRHQRGVLTAVHDMLGNETIIDPDGYWMLPAKVVDAAGLELEATYDYRVMQVAGWSDPNETLTSYAYTPLGQLRSIVTTGADGTGDTAAKPGTKFTYDFDAYDSTRGDPEPQPISVHTVRRIWHASDGRGDDTFETREYSDGFGRLIQRRADADELAFGQNGGDVGLSAPGPAQGTTVTDRVLVSGWQIYDNKGNVIEKYEPFFSVGWDFQAAADARKGQRALLRYDALGRPTRTVVPDGAEQRIVYGIPPDVTDPGTFHASPWESYTYDENDLAPVSKGPGGAALTARAPAAHHYTPRSDLRDAFGRGIATVQRLGADLHLTRSTFDVRGNLVSIIDPLGREAVRYAYDLLGRRLRSDGIDCGLKTSVPNAQGTVVEERQATGAVTLRVYDAVHRMVETYARDGPAGAVTLRERVTHGDTLARAAALAGRLRGRPVKRYDEAGLKQIDLYDLFGRVEESRRFPVDDPTLAAGWTADWDTPGADSVLEQSPYELSSRYNALGHPVQLDCPQDVTGGRSSIEMSYGRGGLLRTVSLDGAEYVTEIAYDALGRRVLIAYGNGVMTRYAYDPESFQLTRLVSEPFTRTGNKFTSSGTRLQDLSYEYDLMGNPVRIGDATAGCGVAAGPEGADALRREFDYDALYRLVGASGRECKPPNTNCGAFPAPYDPGPPVPNQSNAPSVTRLYSETYDYDPAGNLLTTKHSLPSAPGNEWVRVHALGGQAAADWASAPSNHLTSVTQGGTTTSNQYDASGNLIKQNTESSFTWDHAGRLSIFENRPAGAALPSKEARYLYDSDGRRVKKWVRFGGTGSGESTTYIADMFEHFRDVDAGFANNRVHVKDSRERVALVRRGPAYGKDAGPEIQYHLGDHLGSSSVVLRDDRAWVNREEYTPFGDTCFGGFARKRYRHAGKERDEETGLYYYGARYYAPWQSRWVSCDPGGPIDSLNLYVYVRNDPVGRAEGAGGMSHKQFEEHFKGVEEDPWEGAATPVGEVPKAPDPTLLQLRQWQARAHPSDSASAGAALGIGTADKYVYTSHAGIVDLEHVLGTARFVYGEAIAPGASVPAVVNDNLQTREAQERGTFSSISPSSYAADDLPSNALGALFAQHLLEVRKTAPGGKVDVGKELRTFLDHLGWLNDKDSAAVTPLLKDFRSDNKAKSAEPVPITDDLIRATGGPTASKYAGLAGKSGRDLLAEKGLELDPSVVSADTSGPAGKNPLALKWAGGKDPLLPAPKAAPPKPPDKKKVLTPAK
jgi:RHS repeat-associated protein